MQRDWNLQWTTGKHDNAKREVFSIIDKQLTSPPKSILDIGCGYAKESEMFQKKYGSHLYLLDGDSLENKSVQTRETEYGNPEDFGFYMKSEDLKKRFRERGLNFIFVDANRPTIPDIKFDLIYSLLSCGFHYPIETYRNLVLKHSHSKTICIFDIRKETFNQQVSCLRLFKVIDEREKHYKVHALF